MVKTETLIYSFDISYEKGEVPKLQKNSSSIEIKGPWKQEE